MAKDNAFSQALKTFSDVTKAAKAGEITKDEGYQILENIGLHKGPSKVEKAGNILAGVVTSVATVGLATPMVKKILKSEVKNEPVGLIENITKGINKVNDFSKTQIGGQLIGTMGKLVTNLATPGAAKPSVLPQTLALQQGTAQNVLETVAQSAVFQGKGVRVEVGNGSNGETWWSKHKSWVVPVLLAVPGFFVLLFALFGRRRRR